MQRSPSWLPLALLGLVLFGLGPLVTLITDATWFDAVGYGDTFWRMLGAKAVLGGTVALLAFAIVGGSGRWAAKVTGGRVRPRPKVVDNPVGEVLARTPLSTLTTGAGAVIAAFAGLAATSWWDEALLAMQGVQFGYDDPVFGLDASFYVFLLPLVQQVRGTLAMLVFVGLLVAVGVYVTHGGAKLQLVQVEGQLQARGVEILPAARNHVATLASALVLLLAIGAWLQRYTLLHDQRGLFAGPGHADLYGTMPLLAVQTGAMLFAAVLLWYGLRGMSLGALTGAGALALLGNALTSVYPGLLQRFSVDPNELTREGPQIVDHIEATRFAFDLDRVEELTLSGEARLTRSDIEANRATIENVRLWDHRPLLETFAQVQEIRTYYEFQSVDNDRYRVDGDLRQVMLSPRELPIRALPTQARTWVNETMTYTHGYGLTLGPVNEVTPQGLPTLWVKDLPPVVSYEDDLRIDNPSIYFGEAVHAPVLVDTENPEFDFPAGDENAYTTYSGQGGVEVGGALWRGLWAYRLGWTDLMFTSDLKSTSRVLLYRNIVDRVQTVAPFLRLDSDPYLVIVDGRLLWVLDAYTVTDRFPYSSRVRGVGNYVRNPVKVTVDAYDGTLRFYLIDPEEPIAKAWSQALPDLFADADSMPEGLRAHLRVPIDLFTMQSHLFATYHMTDPQIFYNREDEWQVPAVADRRMSPYFTIMKLPGEEGEEFIQMLPFTPRSKNNLAAWMVARSDGEHYGELQVYKFPKDKMVYGPNMIVARINQDDAISEKMSLWNQQGSSVELGTLLVIPIEESLIYVQPLYLRADSGSIPELKRVIVAYENQIAMQPTLEEGLAQIFGTERGDRIAQRAADTAREPEEGDAAPFVDPTLPTDALISEATTSWREANEAAASGDWTRFGAAMQRLGESLELLEREPAAPQAMDPVDSTP
jgi:uncharacterized membrane protein (UPF0182 family)